MELQKNRLVYFFIQVVFFVYKKFMLLILPPLSVILVSFVVKHGEKYS